MAGCAAQSGGVTAVILLSLLVLAAEAQKDVSQVARIPPQMVEPLLPITKYERINSEVILKCEASGIPKPSYQWFYNKMPIDSVSNPGVTYDGYNGTLRITKLTVDNEGYYHCQASNSIQGGHVAVAKFPAIEVIVGRVEHWDVITEKFEKSFNEFSYGYLNCDENLPKFFGPTSFKWYIVELTDEKPEQRALTEDDRRFIDQKGTLHFAYVLQKDELKANEFYACAMSNAVEGFIRIGRHQTLTVGGGTDKTVPPELQYPLKNAKPVYEQRIHKEAQLECFMSAYTKGSEGVVPQIVWKKQKKAITPGDKYSIEQNGRILRIKDLEEDDEAEYMCQSGAAKGYWILNVTSAPIWEEEMESLTVTEDEDAVFHCEARSAKDENPPDKPTWERNGAELKSGHLVNKYRFSDDRKMLTVVGAKKKDDIACFQCYVKNSVDTVFSGACLNVILPIKIETQPNPVQEVTQGDIVNLTAVAKGDPLYHLYYEWFFDNATFTGDEAPPYVQYDPITKVAFINTTGLSNTEMSEIAGVYLREIYNEEQKVFVETEVIFKDEPIVIPVAEAGFDYWIIGLIIGILLIIIVILLICCVICRRKMLEGDYPVDKKEVAAGLDPEKELLDNGFPDLSRADYDFPPEKKPPNLDFDDMPLGDDESFGSEYGGEEATAFNEDGSFIGVYSKGSKKGGPPGYQAAESNV